ncbi:ABC transporter ATP-binding protein [Methanobrevibacter sp.]|uniref:ABC transporter ATP-binding protein n=1 Tax=Methanobrevibacter sp. TaxID=66852 RepID=UPI0025D5BA19|nr:MULTISPECIES: ABC transporter ATP-binding protein [Methanobrevibacter]MDD6776937.1 ABC transporter ATP-binding protein [Methanobacteriaceae archaeon]MDY3096806.1 ABC transporter ATP-binding protein [Methanobrevibacter sp.]
MFVLLQVYFQIEIINMSKVILDNGVKVNNFEVIYNSGILMLIYTLGSMIMVTLVSYITSYITGKVSFDLRSKMFRKVTDLSLYDFNKFESASLMNRATGDINVIQLFILNLLRSCLLIPFVIVGVIIETVLINRTLAAILIVFFIITILFMFIKGNKSIIFFNKLQVSVDRLNLLLREKVYGVRSIRAFGKEDYERNKFEKANDDSYELNIESSLKLYYVAPMAVLLMNVAVVIIYYVGGIQLQYNMVNVADLLLFFQYITYFLSSLALIPFIVKIMPKAIVASNRIEEVFEYEPILLNNPIKQEYKEDSFKGVEFNNVIFGYSGAKDVIADINFKAPKGTTTALIGATGSGKSTVMYLLNRMYDPTFGEILIDGVNIKDIDLKELHSKISFGSQKSMVFNDTVIENIRMSDDSITREDIERACEITLFTDAFKSLPSGIDSIIEENGTNISGGQRQRLSLARTIAKDSDIYIFDDTFSALDMKTEKIVRENIKELLKDKTVFMVAQKISTIIDADNILVFDAGRIVCQGTHEELLEKCEIYKEIYESQAYMNKE